MADPGIQVLVKFPAAVPTEVQGSVLLTMEIALRLKTGLDIRVVKDLMGDDSKLRSKMTIIQRENL